MALIRRIESLEIEQPSLHEEVEARGAIFEKDGRYLLQLNTYGRETRQIPGKVSQTIQFGPEGISELRRLLSQIPE